MKKLFLTALMLFAFPAFAAAPSGTTGAPPTTMIGPLNATKTTLVDSSGLGYGASAVLAMNTSAAAAFIQFFDQPCSGVTVGTTIPSWVQPVLANNWSYVAFPASLGFSTPICVVSTTTPAGAVGSGASVYMQVFTQ